MYNYSKVPNEFILSQEISNSVKICYLSLVAIAEDLQHITLSKKDISDKVGFEERTFNRNISILIDIGLVVKYRKSDIDIFTYVIVPYEIRKVRLIEDEEELDSFLCIIRDFVNSSYDIKTGVIYSDVLKNMNKGFTTYQYCLYFVEQVRIKKNYLLDFKKGNQAKLLNLMKNLTKGKTKEYNLKIIDLYIDTYDHNFKTEDYPVPTIENFNVKWIYNKIVEIEKITNTDDVDTSPILEGVVF